METQRKPKESQGNRRKTKEPKGTGTQRNPKLKEIKGNQRTLGKPKETKGKPWKPKETEGNRRKPKESEGRKLMETQRRQKGIEGTQANCLVFGRVQQSARNLCFPSPPVFLASCCGIEDPRPSAGPALIVLGAIRWFGARFGGGSYENQGFSQESKPQLRVTGRYIDDLAE